MKEERVSLRFTRFSPGFVGLDLAFKVRLECMLVDLGARGQE